MQTLIRLKWIVNCGLSTLVLSSLIACKETDGFNATNFGSGVFKADANSAKVMMTEEDQEDVEVKLNEISNLEKDLNLKEENINALKEEIESLKIQMDGTTELFQTSNSLSPEIIASLKQGNQASEAKLKELIIAYNEYVADSEEQDKIIKSKFTELVQLLSKFETSKESDEFKKVIEDKLVVFEADREKLSEQILLNEQQIADLNQEIKDLQSSETPEAELQESKATEDLVRVQKELEQNSKKLSSIDSIINQTNCALDPVCSSKVKDSVTVNPSTRTMEIKADLEKYNLEKEALVNIVSQLNVEIIKINAEIALHKTSSSAMNATDKLNGLNKILSQRMAEKADAQKQINNIQQTVVGLKKELVVINK